MVSGDLYVTRDGDDDNDGLTPQTALASIQRGMDLIQPGQTLVIGPGEYFGAVRGDDLGSMEAETVIRAEIPGTVILRGDIPAPGFEPLPGYQRVHVADFVSEADIQVVNELDTLQVLPRSVNVAELEYSPGRFYQDKVAGKLYVSTTDTNPATDHAYTLTTVNTHGFYLDTPTRVRVDGLTVTGFNSYIGQPYGQQTLWATYGIFIRNGRHSVISHCRAYLNGRGIGSSNEYDSAGGDNVITHSMAWGNGGVGLGGDTGGIDLLYARRDQVLHSVAFLNQANGISMRGGVTDHNADDASFVRGSLAWGNLESDFWIKAGANYNYYEHSVAFGQTGNTNHLRRSVTGSGSAEGDDSIVLNNESDLDLSREFADPANYDFRLQARSRFIGASTDGSDRGAFEFEENIFYVDPAGSDSADGLSADQAFATLHRALADLPAGATVYLSPGVHTGDLHITLSGTAEAPVIIRGRGRETALVDGRVRIVGSGHLRFERMHFFRDVVVEDSDQVHFHNVAFRGPGTALTAANTVGLAVTQCTFTGFSTAAISLPCSAQAHLAGNLYDNPTSPALRLFGAGAIAYSDYNSYARMEGAWHLSGGSGSVEELRAGHDLAAKERVPVFVEEGAPLILSNPVEFFGGGTAGNTFGVYRRDIPRIALRLLEGPRLHSVSATTANIEWFTSHPAVTTLSWGTTAALENQTSLDVNRFGSYSFTGLTPNTTYYFRIDSLRIPNNVPILADPVDVHSEVLQFTTKAADDPPRTYYVEPIGDDGSSGLTPLDPLRTIGRAAALVNVGDTVVIGGGVYPETVRIRATGSASAPITFRGRPTEQVVLDGFEGLIDFAFVIGKKSHLRFDNFFLANHGAAVSHSSAWEPHMGGQFNIFESNDIQISRVLSDGRTTGCRLVVAKNVDGLQLTNTVDGNKLEGLYLENCPNLRIENTVFARPMIAAFILRNQASEPALIRNCIFTDSLAVKSYQDTLGNPNNVYLIVIDASLAGVVMQNNLFFLRYFSPQDRHLINSSGYDALENVVLFDTMFADPVFQGVMDLLDSGGTLSPYDPDLPPFPPDSLWSMSQPFTFRTWFATDAAVMSAGIGLDQTLFDAVTGLPGI